MTRGCVDTAGDNRSLAQVRRGGREAGGPGGNHKGPPQAALVPLMAEERTNRRALFPECITHKQQRWAGHSLQCARTVKH